MMNQLSWVGSIYSRI